MKHQPIMLGHLKKACQLPDGKMYKLIWACKVRDTIYEVSLKDLLNDGYTMWFVELVEGKFTFLSCSLCLTETTKLLRQMEELEDEDELGLDEFDDGYGDDDLNDYNEYEY